MRLFKNFPDLKPVDVGTFGRVEKVFPYVTKTERRTERGKPPTRLDSRRFLEYSGW